ncbi:hypothetical protein TNCV_5000701 [Trichonephila clavipes]|nr:hypothetical protein TNCV_5000701 [Trichonephila clavipes]
MTGSGIHRCRERLFGCPRHQPGTACQQKRTCIDENRLLRDSDCRLESSVTSHSNSVISFVIVHIFKSFIELLIHLLTMELFIALYQFTPQTCQFRVFLALRNRMTDGISRSTRCSIV